MEVEEVSARFYSHSWTVEFVGAILEGTREDGMYDIFAYFAHLNTNGVGDVCIVADTCDDAREQKGSDSRCSAMVDDILYVYNLLLLDVEH